MFRFPIFCGEVFTYPHAFGGCGMTRQRDNETTGQLSPEAHPATVPPCGSSSRFTGTKNSTFASKSSFRHA